MERKLFFDGTGTIYFTSKRHGVLPVGEREGHKLVQAGDMSLPVKAYELPSARYSLYLSVEMVRLMSALRNEIQLVLTTGASLERALSRREHIPFHVMVAENGAFICDENCEEDLIWNDHLKDQILQLPEVMQFVREQLPPEVLVRQRKTSLIIRNKSLPVDELSAIMAELSIPSSYRVAGNAGWIVYPQKAGKRNAAIYLSDGDSKGTIHVGDDFNDVDLLDWVERPYVMAHAPFEVIQYATERGFFLSEKKFFEGAHEVFSEILKFLIKTSNC